jgi:hypothetical protein
MTGKTKVFIGGDNSPNNAWPRDGVVKQYLSRPHEWAWVRDNVDGYYVNNFAIEEADGTKNDWLRQIANLLKNKQVFYESDMIHSTRDGDETKIGILSKYFDVKYATLNKHGGSSTTPRYSKDRIDGLKFNGGRPVLAMEGPFAIKGSIHSPEARFWKDAIDAMDGSATDGPIGLWATDHEGMWGATRDGVFYAHGKAKLAMVMLASYTSKTGSQFLSWGQHCVRWLEKEGASPDIWVISYYASNIEWFPVTPEKKPDGSPAETLAGMAYWLINHLRDPIKFP